MAVILVQNCHLSLKAALAKGWKGITLLLTTPYLQYFLCPSVALKTAKWLRFFFFFLSCRSAGLPHSSHSPRWCSLLLNAAGISPNGSTSFPRKLSADPTVICRGRSTVATSILLPRCSNESQCALCDDWLWAMLHFGMVHSWDPWLPTGSHIREVPYAAGRPMLFQGG